MSEQPLPDPTVELSAPGDALDQGLAAAFGPDSGPPLPAGASVLKALASDLPSLPNVHLRDPSSGTAELIVLPTSSEMPSQQEPGSRLQLLGEIARGGMGAIFKGRDADLGRDIAVKVLLETHRGKTELAQRFLEEAQIAGQLQHPRMVPVYELGQLADERPYFTMKLVKGKTLAALLAARKDAAEERVKLVGIFAQVCQALAYAHARGVIHRDLKPSNVMVGAFGEVQVMDWGLAKVLKEGGVADEQTSRERQRPETASVIRTQRSAGTPEFGSGTQAGSVLGTPAYMAPEQARGEVELVDARADVFGLGAILCEILTGLPPFTGKNAEALRKAQIAQLDDARNRLASCGADAELVGLARRCLAAEPWDRQRDAGEVAAAVTAYQHSVAEQLRQAEVAQAAEAARAAEAQATAAQERKAREAAQARAVAERRARRLTLGLAASVLALVTVGSVGGMWVQQHRAEQAAAAQRLREAVETALDKAGDLGRQARWAEARAVLDQTRERLGEAGPEDLRQRVEQASADLELVDRLEAIRLKRSTLVEGKFDNQSAERDYAATFRDAQLGTEGEQAETVASRIRNTAVREQLVAALDDWAAVTQNQPRRAWLLEVARRADPDPWRDRFRDPGVWRDRGRLEGLAKELLDDENQLARQSPQLLAALAAVLGGLDADKVPLLAASQARHPDDFWLNYNLGTAFLEAKKWDEAVTFFRGAIAVRPTAVAARNNLGSAFFHKRLLDAAIQEYRRAVALDPSYASAHNNLGSALRENHQPDEAVPEFRLAIKSEPKIAMFHYNLGNALLDKRQWDEAIQEYHRAIELDDTEARYYHNRGRALNGKGQVDAAIREYRRAIQLDPTDTQVYINLALALQDKGQVDAAIPVFRRAIELDPRDAKTHYNFGLALHDKQQLDEAIQEYRRAIQLDARYAKPHNNLGNALKARGQWEEAIAEYRRNIELDPTDARPHFNLGNTLYNKRQLDAAIAEFRRAIELDSKLAQAHRALGNALYDQGQVEAAIQEYRRTIQLNPRDAVAHLNLGLTLAGRQQWDAAIPEYCRAIELDPMQAKAHYSLGDALYHKQQWDAAISEYRRAIELNPKYAEAHCNLGHALQQKGFFTESLAQFREGHRLGSPQPNQ
jgi:tetratricopeptide (TPR) repeat protein/tRNA A-37 threonylcarbamoyl transferase component Bud32